MNSSNIEINDITSAIEILKKDLISTGSHRIRTLLNIVIGFLDIIKDECKTTKTESYIGVMERASKDIINITEFLLGLYNLEEDILFNEEKEFDPYVELDVASYFKGVDVNVHFDRSVGVIRSDLTKVKYILFSIVGAAAKTKSKTSSIDVSVGLDEGLLKVCVSFQAGNSCSILNDFLSDYRKVDFSKLNMDVKVTLLNISVARKILGSIGGSFDINRGENCFVTFCFSVPAEKVKEKGKTGVKADSLKGRRVLIVEDNKANQMFMATILKKAGIELDVADDGKEAIEKFKNNDYDVILMDISMPRMSGIDATKVIRKIENEKGLRRTPIVALTANALRGDRERFIKAGMDEYLTKPVNKDKLFATLEYLLRQNTTTNDEG